MANLEKFLKSSPLHKNFAFLGQTSLGPLTLSKVIKSQKTHSPVCAQVLKILILSGGQTKSVIVVYHFPSRVKLEDRNSDKYNW